MAEEEGGNKLQALLTKKVGGVPVYVYGAIAVLVAAWYLHRKAQSQPTNGNSSTAGDVTSQTWPYGSPLYQGSDVFVNNTLPTGGTAPGTGTSTPTPGGANNNKRPTVTVKPGDSVVNTILSLQSQGVPITYDQFVKLNPDALKNINWAKPNQPRAWDSFRSPATYKLF